MRPIYGVMILILTTIIFVTACSKAIDPLTVKAESPREDAKTEEDIFQQIKERIKDFYFPLNVGSKYLERMKVTYYVEDEHLEYYYDYNTYDMSKEKGSYIPSRFRLFVNNMEQHQISKPQDGLYFALDKMEGYLASPHGSLLYGGTEKTNNDSFVYEFENTHRNDFFEAAKESRMQKQFTLKTVKGYNFLGVLFDMDIVDMLFLDIEQTNFEIAKVDINRDKVVDEGNQVQVSVYYQFEDSYIIGLHIENENKDQKEESRTNWTQDGYRYKLSIEYLSEEAAEVEVSDEQLEEFRSFITRKVTDE